METVLTPSGKLLAVLGKFVLGTLLPIAQFVAMCAKLNCICICMYTHDDPRVLDSCLRVSDIVLVAFMLVYGELHLLYRATFLNSSDCTLMVRSIQEF